MRTPPFHLQNKPKITCLPIRYVLYICCRNSGKKLSMLPFKKGAFHVALDSKMPILPVVISQYDFLDVQNMSFRPGRAIIKVLPRIGTIETDHENIGYIFKITLKDSCSGSDRFFGQTSYLCPYFRSYNSNN